MDQVAVTKGVIAASLRVFEKRHPWGRRHESIVYWAGRRGRDGGIVVTTCVAPRATTTPGSYRTTSEHNARAVSVMNDLNVQLIAQVHSHPGSIVGHSHGDTLGALMPFDGLLSIIVPNYGTSGMWPLDNCGVHEYSGGEFRRLHAIEVSRRFKLLSELIDLR